MILVEQVIAIYVWILILSALLSWFPAANHGALAAIKLVLSRLTEPVLRPVRKVLPQPDFGGVRLDLSVIVVLIGLEIIQRILE
jgi:YggT family protein